MGLLGKIGSFIKNNAHTILDAAGMIPGVGAVADLANAAIYAAEGDWGNALLSTACAVPGFGDTLAVASKGVKLAKGVKTAVKGGKSLKTLLKVGGKSLLNGMDGLAKVGGKFLKKLNPKGLFGKFKNGFKKIFLEAKCFTGDTLVHTEKGLIPIRDVKAGDLIYARNEETGETGLKRVEKTSETDAHTIYSITIENKEAVNTTAYHAFYTEESEWVNSINLKVGDKLVSEEGVRCITAIEKTRYEEPVSVYNFVVEEWHTFFVTKEKICVHNSVRHIINKVKDKVVDTYTKVKQKVKCMLKGEPVDLVSGIVLHESVDFELPGSIPFVWERRYYSDSKRNGVLGHGTFLNYETEIIVSETENQIILLMPDGRAVQFDNELTEEYNRIEKITLYKRQDYYEVFFHEQRLYYLYCNMDKHLSTYKLKEIRNETGNVIQFVYEENNLKTIIDSAGRKLDLLTDNKHRISQVVFGTKKLVSYDYNQSGDLTKIRDAIGQEETINYQHHLLIKITTKNGYEFNWEYDKLSEDAKCIHTWGDNGVLEYHFEYYDGFTISTNSLGYRETVHFNDSNLITKYIDAEGNTTRYEYNDFGELISVENALNQKEYFVYDSNGNVTEHVDFLGAKLSYIYDQKGRVETVIYPNSGEKKWRYDDNGNIERIIYPDQTEIVYSFNKENLISNIEDSLGNKTKYSYDKWGNIIEIVHADESRELFKYDENGNCINLINPLGARQILLYDDLNRVIQAEMQDGNVVQMKYNACNEIVMARDKLRKVEYEYTWSGKIKKRKEKNRIIEYIYDTEEQLLSLVNEEKNIYSFGYDGNGNVIEEIGFDGTRRGFLYNKLGNVIRIDQPDGKQKLFKYDANGNVIEIEYNDGSKDIFKYNNMGNLIETENENSCIKFELDIMCRVRRMIQDGCLIEYEYDEMGQRTQIKSNLGANINQKFNSQGNVSKVSAKTAADASWIAETEYNSLGQEILRSVSGGINSKWDYDNIGRSITQSIRNSNKSSNRKYTWDINSRLRSIAYVDTTINYRYDDYGCLEWSGFNSENIFRSPDCVGNIYKSKEKKDRIFGKAGQILRSNDSSYTYDEQGNLLQKITKEGCWKYIYYDNGFMKEVIRPDGSAVEFKYDSLGRRIEKKYKDKIIRFLWDGDVLLHEWEEEKNINKNVITWVFNENEFTPIAKLTQNENYAIISDHLGTPIEMFSQKGKKVWDSILDIYGNVKEQKLKQENCPFRFPGQYEDEETGLYYNRFRYYSPSDGIYLQQDPIRLNGGWNLYAYVYDPIQLSDPLGLAPPNNGVSPAQHGGTIHNKCIDDLIKEIKTITHGQAENIRKNQQQHDYSQKKVGNNLPDIQYDYQGKHYNIEVDTTQRGSRKHQNQIPKNDKASRNTYWIIDDKGNKTGGHSQLPQTGNSAANSAGPSSGSTPNGHVPH